MRGTRSGPGKASWLPRRGERRRVGRKVQSETTRQRPKRDKDSGVDKTGSGFKFRGQRVQSRRGEDLGELNRWDIARFVCVRVAFSFSFQVMGAVGGAECIQSADPGVCGQRRHEMGWEHCGSQGERHGIERGWGSYGGGSRGKWSAEYPQANS